MAGLFEVRGLLAFMYMRVQSLPRHEVSYCYRQRHSVRGGTFPIDLFCAVRIVQIFPSILLSQSEAGKFAVSLSRLF